MQRNRILIWSTLILTVGISLLALLLPTPASWPPGEVEFHRQLIVNIVMAATHTGGALLFLANLDVYKAKLRRAYIVMAIGTLVTGAGTLQISLLTLANAWTTPYGRSGATMLPFVLSGILLYLGVCSFVKLVGVKHPLAKFWIVLPGAALLTALSTLLPHVNNPIVPEATYDVLVGVGVWSGSLMLSAGFLVMKAKNHAGAHYTHAITWLARALAVSAGVLLYQGVYTLVDVGFNPLLNLTSNIITVISGLMWIRAGYAFALTKYHDGDIPLLRFMVGKEMAEPTGGPRTVIDMVTYAAELVSNSQDIDPLLDKLRAVTVKLKPGERPSAADTKSLVEVYLKLEEYLTTKEALRTFTSKELRSHLSPELRKLISLHEK